MTQQRYDVGDTTHLSTTTTDLAGNLTDPTTMVLWVAAPDGTVTSPAPTHDGVGLFHYDLPLTAALTWSYWWVATGAIVTAGGGVVHVSPRLVPGATGPAGTATPVALVTVAEMRDHLQISGATYDGQLQGYLDAAAILIEEIGDIVLPRQVDETYDGGGTTIILLSTPVVSIASVTEYSGTIAYALTQAATPTLAIGPYQYQVDLASGLLVRLATGSVTRFPVGRRNVFVSYVAGQSSVPANVTLATKELVAHWWRWGQQGNRAAFGDAVPDMAATSSSGYAIPNRVVELLRPLPGVA